MIANRIAISVIFLTLTMVGTVWAAPQSGFSLFGGPSSHRSEGEFKALLPPGTKYAFDSTGFTVGFDYQFAIGDYISINPFYMNANETFTEETNVFSDSTGGRIVTLGAQLRGWIGNFYVGGFTGVYAQIIEFSNGNDGGWGGTGGGLIGGWEADWGLFISGMIESASLQSDDQESGTTVAVMDLTGTRVLVGYRF